MKLYVDGELQGTNPQTHVQPYDGYWRVGGDSSWGGDPHYFNGIIDEAAVYSYELPQGRVLAHYQAGGGVVNQASDRRVHLDGQPAPGGVHRHRHRHRRHRRGYSWDFGDGSTSTEQNPTHVYTDERHLHREAHGDRQQGRQRRTSRHSVT